LIERCQVEGRALVTLDLDFGNPLVFKPSRYAGIAVLRLPRKPSYQNLSEAVQTLIGGLEREDLCAKLWTVEIGRIRIYQEEKEN
jgi:hypothetical protein